MPYDITDAMRDIQIVDQKIESLAQALTELITELQDKKVIEKHDDKTKGDKS